MIVVDSTVLVYATGTEHPYRDPCRQLVEAVADGRVAATTTVEVIQEFTHVRARRRSRADAAGLARAYVDLLSPLLPVNADALLTGLDLFGAHPLGAFDAVLAAAARAGGAHVLVSADSAFADVAGLNHIVPDQQGVDELLAASAPPDLS